MSLPPRLAALVVKNGVSLGLLGPADRALVLAFAALSLTPAREYREAEVNDKLLTWLDGPGAMLRVDHVELRRWLVDAGFVARDGFGRAYMRGNDQAARAEALLGAGSPDEHYAAVDQLRAARTARREAQLHAHANA